MSDIGERYEASDRNAGRAAGPLHHPLVAQVFKTALAAGVAYAAGNALPGPFDQYAYYAPLGAVTVMYPAVADSVLQGIKATAAILIGVALAVLTMFITWPSAFSVAAVVGIGTAIAALAWFGEQRSWLPLAALFVLTASEPHTEVYVLGYISQLPLGAAAGILANVLIFPQMSLHDLDNSVHRLRVQLIDQLNRMVAVLRGDEFGRDGWRASLQDLEEPRRNMRDLTDRAKWARRGNIRSHRWEGVQRDLLELSDALERCSFLVEDVGVTLTEYQAGSRPIFASGLQAQVADTLELLAEVLAHPGEAVPNSPRTQRAEEAVDGLLRAIDRSEFTDSRSRILAGSVGVSAARVLFTFASRHGIEELKEQEEREREEDAKRDEEDEKEKQRQEDR